MERKKFIGLLLLIFFFTGFSQVRRKADSLFALLKKNLPADTSLVNIYNETAFELRRVNPDSSKLFAEKAQVLSLKLNYKKGSAFAYNNLGVFYHIQGDYPTALRYYEHSKKLKEELNDKKGVANIQNNIGISYAMQGYYDKALAYYFNSLKLQQEIGDTLGMANTYNYLASSYLYLADYDKALKNYLQAIHIHERLRDEAGLSQEYNNIGIVYTRLGNIDKAIESYKASISFLSTVGDKYMMASAYNNLGSAMREKKEYELSLSYYQKSLQLSKEMNQTRGIAYNLVGIAGIYEIKKEYKKALDNYAEGYKLHELTSNRRDMANCQLLMAGCYLEMGQLPEAENTYLKSLALSKETKAKDLVSQCYQGLARLYKLKKDFKNSYQYLTLYAGIRDSMLNEEKNKSMAEMQTRFDTDKKEKEIVLLSKNKNLEELRSSEQKASIKKQQVVIYASLGGITLALTLAFFVLQGYRQKKQANLLLEQKNDAIAQQKQILEEKNVLITDSIEYAKNIQDAILPPTSLFESCFKESFVLFKPKDVVSGDFYWLVKLDETVYLASVDCVGHGVPGAFMALHAYNLLERIVKGLVNPSPAQILDELNKNIITSLNQSDGSAAKHGMDMSLLKIKESTVEFAGARNPLVICTLQAELIEVKADKMYVGGALGSFTNNKLAVEKGSMLYVFTDGYADQKGGAQNKKFFAEPFRSLLKEVSLLDCNSQMKTLEEKHIAWKGNNEQMDDILVIGIRL